MTLNDLMAALVEELTEAEIPLPLAQEFTLANVWCDLARLAGEELPAEALAVVGRALDATIEPVMVRRGSYAEHALEFAPADVAAVLDTPLDFVPPSATFSPHRGSYADQSRHFAEAYAD